MYFKQVDEIARGWKQCTQRVCKEGEWSVIDPDTGEIGDVYDTSGRLKWHVGGTYAVSPGRGQPGVWWKTLDDGEIITTLDLAFDTACTELEDAQNWANANGEDYRKVLRARWFDPLRIRLTKIERLRLQTMTEAVAVAEGVATLAAYIELWTYINPGPLVNWDANPLVWRLWFEVVRTA